MLITIDKMILKIIPFRLIGITYSLSHIHHQNTHTLSLRRAPCRGPGRAWVRRPWTLTADCFHSLHTLTAIITTLTHTLALSMTTQYPKSRKQKTTTSPRRAHCLCIDRHPMDRHPKDRHPIDSTL